MTDINQAVHEDEQTVEMTDDQRQALARKWNHSPQEGMTYDEFVKSAKPTFGCNDAIAVKWCGMWLCIETDGYTHS